LELKSIPANSSAISKFFPSAIFPSQSFGFSRNYNMVRENCGSSIAFRAGLLIQNFFNREGD
jgi:hypothetical protein